MTKNIILFVVMTISLVGCHFDGPFIEEKKGEIGLLGVGQYLIEEKKPDRVDDVQKGTIQEVDDGYSIVIDNDETSMRVAKIDDKYVVELSDGRKDMAKSSVLMAKLSKTDTGFRLYMVDSNLLQELLRKKKGEWKLVENANTVIKDQETYRISGTQTDRYNVMTDILKNHPEVFQTDKWISFDKQ